MSTHRPLISLLMRRDLAFRVTVGTTIPSRRIHGLCPRHSRTRRTHSPLVPPPTTTTRWIRQSSSSASSSSPSSVHKEKALSTLGIVFFGSLCLGTFGLGCWQLQRLLEKQVLVEQRTNELQMPPRPVTQLSELIPALQNDNESTTPSSTSFAFGANNSFRRIELVGTFQHDKECLVGPRSPPSGLLPDKPGSSGQQGMATAPQGFFVVTPLVLPNKQVVLVNRGWIPREMAGPLQNMGRRSPPQTQTPSPTTSATRQWSRPTGQVSVTAVLQTPEQPKTFLVAQHDLQQRPPKLFWFDWPTMLAVAGLPWNKETVPPFVTAVTSSSSSSSSNNSNNKHSDTVLSWPGAPSAERVGDFKVSPAVHASYAVTWYGLSAAGVYMTRKLLRRGR